MDFSNMIHWITNQNMLEQAEDCVVLDKWLLDWKQQKNCIDLNKTEWEIKLKMIHFIVNEIDWKYGADATP